ncbi:MAG: hypothetical protein JWR42_2177 [Marmoricola sp.]|nr:hypothetical protein [Marmoricola sp.]
MPTYQYSCTECGHFFEIQQSFSEDSLTVCPVCEGRLRKVFNAVGVVFKGSGFYRNDSREAAKSSSGGTSSTPAAASSTGEKSAPAEKSSGSKDSSGSGSSSSGSTGSSSTSGSSGSSGSSAAGS